MELLRQTTEERKVREGAAGREAAVA